MKKRLTFKRDPKNEERLVTPTFVLDSGLIQGVILDNSIEIKYVTGERIYYAVLPSLADAKREMKVQMRGMGVMFLDEVRGEKQKL